MAGKSSQFTKNILASVSVQALSLLISLLSGFLIPKFIDEYQYAYREIYMLYSTYVGLLHFGLLDGLMLRYAAYDYEGLDKARIRSQFRILLASTGLLSLLGIACACLFLSGVWQSIVIFLSIGSFTKNMVTYQSYCFQFTNRISQYARLIFVQRLLYGILIVLFLVLGINDFRVYCIADLLGDIGAIAISAYANRKLCIGRALPLRESAREWTHNMSAGAILLLSNLSASLLLGSAKMIIQWRWDELTFGKVSFAFSITNLFLTFITAISVVLFPSLKRMEAERLPALYGTIRGAFSPILFLLLLGYFPGCMILERFLPAYRESLYWLGILLPIVVYSSKVNLLTNNYLKAYRKERTMLLVNLSSIAVALALFLIGAYGFGSLRAVLFCVVAATVIHAILSEIAVMKTIGVRLVAPFFKELLMTAVFMAAVSLFSLWIACAVYFVFLTVYLFTERRHLIPILKKLIRR